MAEWSEGDLQEGSGESETNPHLNLSLTGAELIKHSYRLCRRRFEEYFPLAVGGAVVAFAGCYGLDHLRGVLSNSPPIPHSVFDQSPPVSAYLRGQVFLWLLWGLEILAGWTVMTVTFACVAIKVLGEASGAANQKIHASETFRLATTQHFRAIARVALAGAFSTIFYASFLLPALLRPLPQVLSSLRIYNSYFVALSAAQGLILGVFGLLISTMAPAVPCLIAAPGQTLRSAIDIGLRSTAAHLRTLFLWLGTSAAAGWLVYFALTSWLNSACVGGVVAPAACSLLPPLFAVVLIALFACPAFIWFSYLYLSLHADAKVMSLGTAG